MWKDKHMGRWI